MERQHFTKLLATLHPNRWSELSNRQRGKPKAFGNIHSPSIKRKAVKDEVYLVTTSTYPNTSSPVDLHLKLLLSPGTWPSSRNVLSKVIRTCHMYFSPSKDFAIKKAWSEKYTQNGKYWCVKSSLYFLHKICSTASNQALMENISYAVNVHLHRWQFLHVWASSHQVLDITLEN